MIWWETKIISSIKYIKHETQCFITRWNTEKRVENMLHSWVFFNVAKCNLGKVKHETMLASGLHH